MKGYIQSFPEIKRYILKNNSKWYQNLNRLPKDHDIKKFYPKHRKDPNFDANICLFKIYGYILKEKSNSLRLNSALCLNASQEKVQQLVEKIDGLMQKEAGSREGRPRQVKVDKHCLAINNLD